MLQGRVPVIALAAVVLAMNLNSGHMVDMAAVGVGGSCKIWFHHAVAQVIAAGIV